MTRTRLVAQRLDSAAVEESRGWQWPEAGAAGPAPAALDRGPPAPDRVTRVTRYILQPASLESL
eukprot:268172-Hanusia_phi.AAC.1